MVRQHTINVKKNYYTIIVGVLLTAALIGGLFATNFQIRHIRNKLDLSTKNYIEYEKEARNIERASDYLTTQTQAFVQTGDIRHVLLYFEEINVTKRRENSLKRLQSQTDTNHGNHHAVKAVQHSNELMETEFYAMKLTSAALNYDYFDLPKQLNNIHLTAEDAQLSHEEKLEKARNMVFNDDYHHKKAVIYEHLTLFTRGILFQTENKLQDDLKSLSNTVIIQQILLATVVIFAIVCYILILRFLRRYNKTTR